jgi:DNA polymerase elongation subunit (family B)
MKILNILAKESNPTKLTNLLPEILAMLQEQLAALKAGEVPLEELVVTQILSREPERYSVLSPSAVVARQLQALGKSVKRGQQIKFIYIAPAPGVWAWDAPTLPNPKTIDQIKYRELLIRAVHEVLQPLGVTEAILKNWLISEAGYLAPPGLLATTDTTRLALPLLADVKHLYMNN